MMGVRAQATATTVQGMRICLCAKVQQESLCRESPHASSKGWLQHSTPYCMPELLTM